jgi:hypothetical protein
VSDEEDEGKQSDDDGALSNSISSVSIDGLSLNNTNTTTSGMSNIQQTSDYESFADCMRQSPIATAALATALPLTNINFDNRFSIQSSVRVNGEGSPSIKDHQRRRKNGTSTTIRQNGKTVGVITTNNEIPLLSHLFGTHTYNNDSNLNSISKQ